MPADQIRRYESGALPFEVDVFVDTYEGPGWVRRLIRGRRGWLRVSRARMSTPISDWQGTLVAAVTDDEVRFGPLTASAFFNMRSSDPREAMDAPCEAIDAVSENLMWDFLGTCDLRHLRMLAEVEQAIDARVAAEQERGERVLADADQHIAALHRQLRDRDVSVERRAQLTQTIAFFEEKQAAAAAWLVRHLAKIRDERTSYETDVFEALENHGEVEELFTVRWIARHYADVTVKERRMRDEAMSWGLSTAIGLMHERLTLCEVGFNYPHMQRLSRGVPIPPAGPQRLQRPLAKVVEQPIDALARLLATARPTAAPTIPAVSVPSTRQGKRVVQLANISSSKTPAQRTSAARRADRRQDEAALATLIAEFPTVALLDARLDKVPSTGIENRRLARLIRLAIGRLKTKSPVAEHEDDA